MQEGLETKTSTSNINKLLRSKYNKNDLLIMESKFNEFELDLIDSSNHSSSIGFVFNNAFSLVDGKYTANGYILAKFIIDSINFKNNNNQNNDLSIINYKTQSQANIYRSAKIIKFFS